VINKSPCGLPINPNFTNGGRTFTWSENTSYHALQVKVSKKVSHGLSAEGSFTFGKSIDEGSSNTLGDQFINSVSTLFWFDRRIRRAVSDYNVPRSLSVNFNYLVPSPNSSSALESKLVKGWSVGGILSVQDGLPLTPLISGDVLGTGPVGGINFGWPDRLTGSGCDTLTNPGNITQYVKQQCFATPTAPASMESVCYPTVTAPAPGPVTLPANVPCYNLMGTSGRNIMKAPGLITLDFNVTKNTYVRRISEAFNLQFKADLFNITNRVNYGQPIQNNRMYIFDANGNSIANGTQITGALTPGRVIQFALKAIW